MLIDGSNRAMVNLLKIKFGESLNWDSKTAGPNNMTIIPVNFATEHTQMSSHLHQMISQKYLVMARMQLEEINTLLEFDKGRLDAVKEEIRRIYNTNGYFINVFARSAGIDNRKIIELEKKHQNAHRSFAWRGSWVDE